MNELGRRDWATGISSFRIKVVSILRQGGNRPISPHSRTVCAGTDVTWEVYKSPGFSFYLGLGNDAPELRYNVISYDHTITHFAALVHIT